MELEGMPFAKQQIPIDLIFWYYGSSNVQDANAKGFTVRRDVTTHI